MWKLSYEVEIRSAYKLDIIYSWYPLLSFIGLCTFYPFFSPWFEITLKSLRLLQPSRYQKCIPIDAWSTILVKRFDRCKKGNISSPVLARYDSDTHCFLNIDWSVVGMEYILLQPDDREEFKTATVNFFEKECVILS